MPQASYGRHTNWLSVFTIDPAELGATRDDLLAALAAEDIEARPVWKPMHLQPVFAACDRVGGAVSEDLFARGICLPSSSSLTKEEQDRVVAVIRRAARTDAPGARERAAWKVCES
jgi:pyridoxal phosphate-dependent aminotransferase EpsN